MRNGPEFPKAGRSNAQLEPPPQNSHLPLSKRDFFAFGDLKASSPHHGSLKRILATKHREVSAWSDRPGSGTRG